MTFTVDPPSLIAFALALVRAAAWLFVSPPFNTRIIPTTVKAGVAATLALAAVPHIAGENIPLDTGGFLTALVTQAVVGFALGMFTLFLVNALQAAGSLVDIFAGFSLAATFDPINQTSASIFGRFYEVLATTLLFTTNAYLILVNGWLRSFQVVPAHGLAMNDIANLLTKNLGEFFVSAIEVAAPVLGSLFLAEVLLGLVSRAAPQLNVFSLAFPVRVVVALIVVGLAVPLIAPAIGNLVRQAVAPLGSG